jgi:hypothetical protein
MAKVSKTQSRSMLLGFLLVSIVVFGALVWAGWQTNRLNYVYDQTTINTVREQALLTARLSKTPVPIDAKSGELFFAQEKLYLPAKDEERRLNFGYLPSTSTNAGEWDLSVSSDFAFMIGANKVYGATDTNQLYRAIAELDSCQRGVRVVEKRTPTLDNESTLVFKRSVAVSDTRTVYLYADKGCSNLDDVVYQLQSLKAY